MDVSESLIDHVIGLTYEQIPEDVVLAAKLAMLDTLGCMVAGANAPGCYELRGLVADWGGVAQGTVVGADRKAPCANAAFVNATAARALDFDPVWGDGRVVDGASVLVVFAVAEPAGVICGRALRAAVIAGEDLAVRVHMGMSGYHGFEPSGVTGM